MKEGLLVKVGYKITRQDVVKIELSRAEVTLNSNPLSSKNKYTAVSVKHHKPSLFFSPTC
jgi:hypothetical protein